MIESMAFIKYISFTSISLHLGNAANYTNLRKCCRKCNNGTTECKEKNEMSHGNENCNRTAKEIGFVMCCVVFCCLFAFALWVGKFGNLIGVFDRMITIDLGKYSTVCT